MNKIEKTIVQLICKYIARHSEETKSIDNEIFSFDIPQRVVLNYIGSSYGAVTETLTKFKRESLINDCKEINTSFDDIREKGWKIVFNPDQITKLYDRSVEGLKLKTEQISLKKSLQKWAYSLVQKYISNITESMIKKEFDEGKWLRLCCPACGDFIQEITTFKELKELEGKEIICPRHKHKLQYKIIEAGFDICSIDVDLIQLLKEKKVEKS